ncbi:MAG: hypothetical protein GC168_10475 [Candidatus Hydrogenedens sp.]|nr:hypothetical protein [Candidatus Hydrogenedens sp.]
MTLGQFIKANRPVLLLALLVSLCLASLGTGFESTIIHRGIERVVSLTAYPFLRTGTAIDDFSNRAFGALFSYDAIVSENEALSEDVAVLKMAIADRREASVQNRRLQGYLGFLRQEPRLRLEPARVIESLKGVITIDRGSLHGMEPFMGVITPEGVVGVILSVDDLSSKVATLHHPDCKVGAMVERNRLRAYDGIIHADGSFRQICNMWYIDMKNEVLPGELIVTSPESLFPSGYPIGYVRTVHSGEALLKYAEVQPIVDPYKLDEVFVIVASGTRLYDLEGPPRMAARTDLAPLRDISDEIPIQEQLAP